MSSSIRTVAPSSIERLRGEFPILAQKVHGKPLAYLDNAATTQKPRVVIDALARFYSEDNANVHRGVHVLSERATRAFEGARETVRRFLDAASTREVVFVRGTTEAINLVAQSFARPRFREGDEILVTEMEHHSNIVPWQLVCEQTGAKLRVVPITDDGELRMEDLERLLGPRTRLLAVTHVSNALGTVNPVREIVALAHERGVPVLLDGAQGVAHERVSVRELDCDFYAFSGHKVYGPTGVGVLYGKERWLASMPPYQGGGDMIRSVTFAKSTWADLPYKFEAGTPHVAGVVGLGAALEWLAKVSGEDAAAHERDLLEHATRGLSSIPGLRIVGTAAHKVSLVSFVIEGVHPHDLGTVLDHGGLAIRAGHHCAQPLMERFGVPATARASFALYNTRDEVDRLVEGVREARRLFVP